LTLWQWVVCVAFASLVLWTTEIEKIFRRRSAAQADATAVGSAGALEGQTASAI
jgi:hypothetical protein